MTDAEHDDLVRGMRMAVLRAQLAGIDRWDDVARVVRVAESMEAAAEALRELLRTDDAGAQHVLDLQVRSLHPDRRARLVDELETLEGS